MSFKKRLIIIFLTITLLPLFLTCIALLFIGSFLNSPGGPGENGLNMNWAVKSYGQLTEEIVVDIDNVIDQDSTMLENIDYLNKKGKSVSLITYKFLESVKEGEC